MVGVAGVGVIYQSAKISQNEIESKSKSSKSGQENGNQGPGTVHHGTRYRYTHVFTHCHTTGVAGRYLDIIHKIHNTF